jgi:Flp pilus assembly protein TadB
MAQTRRKRKRKHRGTQGGSVDRRRRSRPRSRDEARAQARRQTGQRRDRPPTWRSSFNRSLLMATILFALLVFVTGQGVAPAAGLSLFMLAFYVPAGYYLERFLYKRRQAAVLKARQRDQQGR